MSQEKKNIFQRLFGRGEQRKGNIPTFATASQGWLGAVHAGSNSSIMQGSDSLQLAAVYACVSKISDTIASMGVSVEKREKDGSSEPLFQHPASYTLGVQPNEHMGAYEFWQMIISDALLYGTGHALITPDRKEMFWIPATEMEFTIDRKSGKKYYKYHGAPTPIPSDSILEVKAFRGESPTKIQLQNLKTAKSVQNFGATFFENGGMLGGILTTKEPLSIDQMQQASERWRQEYMGSGNAHKVAILGGGFNYQSLSVPLDQLQFLQSKKYATEEIARFYSIPPAMIGMDGNTAYSNYEQQVLQFFQGTILPWVRRIELEVERKLLRDDESLSCRFDVDSLLRADSASRAQYYHSMLTDGVYSINEVRAREGLGPIEGGSEHHIQLNQIPLSKMADYAEQVVSAKPDPTTDGDGGEDNEEQPGVDNQMKPNKEEE
jgi:HK97 family phage portal protein